MPDNIEIQALSVIRPFVATLPDDTVRRDSIVYATDNEFRLDSHDDFIAKAQAKTADYLAALASLEDAQAVRDAEELIEQIEQIADLADPGWVDAMFTPGTQSAFLLGILTDRRAIARPLVENATAPAVPRTQSIYGDMWTRWLADLPVG